MDLITRKLKPLADACDWDGLHRKRKAINTLFPYAVRQERDKEYAILNVVFHAAKTSRWGQFEGWHHVQPFLDKLFDGASHVSSKRALILISPYMSWGIWGFREDRARIWAAAATTVPKEEEIAPSVVDSLLQIAYHKLLPPHLYGDAWSWLKLRPLLPPVCEGRRLGANPRMVRMVRDLKDAEILKFYLLLVWSEWAYVYDGGRLEMQDSIREDFRGIEMNSHRADLLQRLDHILAELDRGLKHFQKYAPSLNRGHLRRSKIRYREFRETLLEVDREASEVLIRTSPRSTALSELLTHTDVRRITFDVHVRTPY